MNLISCILPVVLCIIAEMWLCSQATETPKLPNIVFIVADDLGWDDVGFHGSEIKTPNIDRLATEGIILNNYYVQPICTPTRSAFLTAKYPIHTGLQVGVPMGAEPYGMPVDIPTLPEKLREYGYANHAVGKWHLGFFKDEYLPENRGFDSFLGYYNGHADYFDHHFHFDNMVGLDFHFKKQPAWNYKEQYATEVYTERAKTIIETHNKSTPLFLYLPHQAPHSADWDPISAPQKYLNRFPYIWDKRRKYFAGAVSAVDDSVGIVYQTLVEQGMADNTLIIFSTDNGGPTNGRENNAACNWPLRGSKATLWQGGVHGVGFLHSPLLKTSGYVSNHLMHASDWMPTVLSLVEQMASTSAQHSSGGQPPKTGTFSGGVHQNLEDIDGIDQWNALSLNQSTDRKEILLNIEPKHDAGVIVGDFKFLMGEMDQGKYDGWYPPPPHGKPIEMDNWKSANLTKFIPRSSANARRGSSVKKNGKDIDLDGLIQWMNKRYEDIKPKLISQFEKNDQAMFLTPKVKPSAGPVIVNCGPKPVNASTNCNLRVENCLFNLRADPCEYLNLGKALPNVMKKLYERFEYYSSTMVPPLNKPSDPMGNPARFGYVWEPWR